MSAQNLRITIGGDLGVYRLGFGAMRLCGEGVWGWPRDRENALSVLRRAVELGVDFIDTADAYGPGVNEEQIAQALRPYPPGLAIATKGGATRSGPGQWGRNGHPAYLARACDESLARLRVERIDLYQLHAVDPAVPFDEQVGALKALRDAGKIRHAGLSNVDLPQLQQAEKIVPIASVQNQYNIENRYSDPLLDYCQARGIAFIAYFPLGGGSIGVDRAAALRWLLARSPALLPIPGTSSLAHLEANVTAAADATF